jgi:hypothetical protein
MMNCEEMGQKGVLQQLFARGTPGLAGHLIGGFMFFFLFNKLWVVYYPN